jgi:hypothetical protein
MSPKPARGWRRRIALPAALVGLTLGVGAVGALTATADEPPPPFGVEGSNFEILDGNTVVNNPQALTPSSIDWDSLNLFDGPTSPPDAADPPANSLTATVKADLPSGKNDDSFGQGTKEDTAVPTIVVGSIPPNKSDLKEFGSWVEKNDEGQFLHLFWTRVQDPSGTTNMDFEFNKKACVEGGNTSGCSANGKTPERSNNDLLITYDLSKGGTVATISLRRWSHAAQAWGPATTVDQSVATGSINTTSITSGLTGATYSPRTFGEASINLSTIFTAGACESFGSAYLKSRSSDSFTSALKDFITPVGVNISNCGRLIVHKRAGSTTGALLPGAGFTITPGNNADPSVSVLGNISSNGTADTGVYCIDSLLFGATYSVAETTVPAGYTGAAAQNFTPNETDDSGTCGTVTTATSPSLTFVNQLQTGSIRINKTDDAGAQLGGATITAYVDAPPLNTPTTGPGAEDTTVAGSCTTATAAQVAADPTLSLGTCTIASLQLGAYWLVETTTPTGYSTAPPVRVVLDTAGATVDRTFVDPRQFKIITLVCKVADSSLYSSGVVYNGGTSQSSLSGVGLTPEQQAAICATGGAVSTVNKTPASPATAHTNVITIP